MPQSRAAQLRDLLDRLLKAVDSGELDASSAHGKALLRRLEGARAALGELTTRRSSKKPRPRSQ